MAIRLASQAAFPAEEPEFQVAPMIDILLVLMTFFMSITSTEVLRTKTHVIRIDPPVAIDSQRPTDRSKIVLNVGWDAVKGDGVIECEERVLKSPSEIVDKIRIRRGNRPDFSAVIRASREVPYRYMQQVMRACADAGVDNLSFVVLNREKGVAGHQDREAPSRP